MDDGQDAESQLRQMMGAIVGFEMEVLAWRPTFKLSQNKPADERTRVAAGLEAEGSPAIAELMRKLVP
jgi:transcriptional regulator